MKVWSLILIISYFMGGTGVEKTDINFPTKEACKEFIKSSKIDRGEPRCVETIIVPIVSTQKTSP